MLDFSQDFITDSKLKITCKERTKYAQNTRKIRAKYAQNTRKIRAKYAVFLTLKLTQVEQFDILLTWLGYTNQFKEAQRLS